MVSKVNYVSISIIEVSKSTDKVLLGMPANVFLRSWYVPSTIGKAFDLIILLHELLGSTCVLSVSQVHISQELF